MRRRIAVTGLGLVSPLGPDAAANAANAAAGRSAIERLDDLSFASRLAVPIAARVRFDGSAHFDPQQLRMLDRVSQLAVVATRQAIVDSGHEPRHLDRDRVGVFVGCGMGGSTTMDEGYRTLYGDRSDRIKPFTILAGMHNAPAAWIGIEYGFSGPNLTYSTACSSSAVAIGEAWLRLASGSLDLAIAGGAEAPLTLGAMKAWEAMHTIASIDPDDPSTSCKPFARNRSGMVLGEGAAMLVLEPWDRAVARGAFIHGEMLGYGLSTDHVHITRPSVAGQASAMRLALRSADLLPSDIDAINAHGTGTMANDAVETAAIKTVFGDLAYDIPISATKALHGHLLGATAALEGALSLLAMRQGIALPTMHLLEPDADCDLDYVANHARADVGARIMLSNSFAFGGANAVLALGAGPGQT